MTAAALFAWRIQVFWTRGKRDCGAKEKGRTDCLRVWARGPSVNRPITHLSQANHTKPSHQITPEPNHTKSKPYRANSSFSLRSWGSPTL